LPCHVEELKTRPLEEVVAIVTNSAAASIDRIAAVSIVFDSMLPPEEKFRILAYALSDSNQTVRCCVIYHLGQLGAPEVVGLLQPFTRDECEDVQFETLRALALAGSREIIGQCADFLTNGNSDQKEGAIVALGFLRCPESLHILENEWDKQELSWGERVVLAISMARHGSRLGEHFLENELESNDEWRIPMAAALAALDNKVGLREVSRLSDELPESERPFLEGHLFGHLEGKPGIDMHDSRAVVAWLEGKIVGSANRAESK
jgi:hypothetical protein